MPQPIILTEKMKRKAITDFKQLLNNTMHNGVISYNETFTTEAEKAILWFTPRAYHKTTALINGFDKEVGWHGIVSRIEGTSNEYLIEDIIVFPQDVTSVTVDTKQAEYSKWLYSFDDDIFEKIRMQSHSHCNMGVTPSKTDDEHRQAIVSQLNTDKFYIFMIWNKSLSVHALIYDMAINTLFETDDIEIRIHESEDIAAFLADAKSKVRGCERR